MRYLASMEDITPKSSSQASPTISNTSTPTEQERLSNGRLACTHNCTDRNRCGHKCCQYGLTPPPVRQERLSNGRLACHHLCTEKGRCGHICCRDGLSRPHRRRAPRPPRASRARKAVEEKSAPAPLDLQRAAINNRVNGLLTPVTPDTPMSQKWSATHFPSPTHFMESPAGSGGFVVLLSLYQRRPEGMSATYSSRSDALRAGLTEVWEAWMWDKLSDLQVEIDQNRDVSQPPIWASSTPRGIPYSAQAPQQVQNAGYRSQSPAFRQVQAELWKERDRYGQVPGLVMSPADQRVPRSVINPALQSISIMAGIEADTNSATGTSTSTSTKPGPDETGTATSSPEDTTIWAQTSTAKNPDMATTDSPSAQTESRTPSALQLSDDHQSSLFTNEQLNEMLGGNYF